MRRTTTLENAQLAAPHSRVRVAVRCRPAFAEEGAATAVVIPPATATTTTTATRGDAADDSKNSSNSRSQQNVVWPRSLLLQASADKMREFTFDAVFGPESSNGDVYDAIAYLRGL